MLWLTLFPKILLISDTFWGFKIRTATGAGAEREIVSEPVSGVYTTKPLPPKDFKTEEDKIMFSKSNSPIVRYL